MWRKILHIIKSKVTLSIFYVSKLWKRDNRLWCFVDDSNSFYLFLQLCYNNNPLSCYLLVNNKHRAKELRKYYKGVLYINSLKAILIQLKASMVFLTHSMPSKTSFSLMGGAIKFNLWHGIGIKNMGCINKNPNQDLWLKVSDREKKWNVDFLNAYPDILLASSPASAEWLSQCFGLPMDKIVISSYPRIDVIKTKILENFIHLPINKHYIDLIDHLKNFKKTFLYMPTWRDDNRNFFVHLHFDLNKLNEHMKKIDSIFIFKFHPYTKLPESCKGLYSNLIFLDSNYDVYPWIDEIDVLITDYSSIYYEFIILDEDKEIILFPFDEYEYKNDKRGLFFNYERDMPASRVYNFQELMSKLVLEKINLIPERNRIIKKFWNYNTELIDLLELCNYNIDKISSSNILKNS